MTRVFNNREIATILWGAALLGLILRYAAVRVLVRDILISLSNRKILGVIGFMGAWTGTVVWVLSSWRMWDQSLIKDTVVWFVCSGFVAVFSLAITRDCEASFRKLIAETLGVVIIVEFLVNTYVFSLLVELVLIPALASVAVIGVLSGKDERYAVMARLCGRVQLVAGSAVVVIVTIRALGDLHTLGSIETVRGITLAPLLFFLHLPFFYATLLYSAYEVAFLRLRLGRPKSKRLLRYARHRLIMYAGVRLPRIQRLISEHPSDLMGIRTKEDVEKLVGLRPPPESALKQRATAR